MLRMFYMGRKQRHLAMLAKVMRGRGANEHEYCGEGHD
jgi:hypothetical protein